MENSLSREIARFYKEIVGSGPERLKVYILEDLIVIRLVYYKKNYLKNLSEKDIVLHQLRDKLFEDNKGHLKELIKSTVGCDVKEFHYDSTVESRETIIVAVCG